MQTLRRTARHGGGSTVAAFLALANPTDVLADGWGGALGAASEYVFRGVTESDHLPSLQVEGHYRNRSGLFAGIWVVSVKEASDRTLSAEVNPYLGYTRPLDQNWTAQLSATHYFLPGYGPRRDYDYDEVAASLSYRDRATLTVTGSPNTSIDSSRGSVSSRPAYSYELVVRQPMRHAFSIDAGVGYYDLHPLVDTGYVYWNAGIGYDHQAFHFALSYIGTDRSARVLFGSAASDRLVGSVVWRF